MKPVLAVSAVLNFVLIMMLASGANPPSSKEDKAKYPKPQDSLFLNKLALEGCREDLAKANQAYEETIKAWEKSNENIFAKWRALDRRQAQVPAPLQQEMTDWFEAQNRQHDYFYQRAREYGWVR